MLHQIHCDCGVVLEIQTVIIPGFASFEEIQCPICHAFICRVRSDGLTQIQVVATVQKGV